MSNHATVMIIRASALATAFLFLPGIVSADRRGEKDPRERTIETLRERNLRLRQQAAMDRVEIERLRQDIQRLQDELEAARAGRTPTAEIAPIGPVTPPGPAIESSELEVPTRALPESAVRPRPSNLPTPPIRSLTPSRGSGDELQSIYDEGYTLFHQKRYTEAEARFAAFLARSDSGDLDDNAHFWIGECRFARGDLQSALTAFTGVVDRYPKGNKVPDAMIKAGKTLEALGDRESARATYLEVRSRFPGTAAAVSAAELLRALD